MGIRKKIGNWKAEEGRGERGRGAPKRIGIVPPAQEGEGKATSVFDLADHKILTKGCAKNLDINATLKPLGVSTLPRRLAK